MASSKNRLLIFIIGLLLGTVGGVALSYYYELEYEIYDYLETRKTDNFIENLDNIRVYNTSGNSQKLKNLDLTAEESEAIKRPHVSDERVSEWSQLAAVDTMTLGFHNYQNQLNAASNYFSPDGWRSFSSALKSAQLIESIKEYKQAITAKSPDADIIVSQGEIDGQYQWVVKVPLVLTYQSALKSRTDNWMVTLVVVRVPESQNPDGLAIAQWIALPNENYSRE